LSKDGKDIQIDGFDFEAPATLTDFHNTKWAGPICPPID